MSDNAQQVEAVPGDVPPTLPWAHYAELVTREWASLLETSETREPEVLQFLRRHPAMVPGARGFTGGHHGPIHDAVFVEPQLPGIRRPVPDFMWVVRDTEAVRPILIEVEDPKKRWFKGNGLPTDEFQHALRQLSEWRRWFSKEANVLQFRDLYELDGAFFRHRPLEPEFCLIYGRQGEFAGREDLLDTRRGMRPAGVHWMTFDGLAPDDYATDTFAVQVHVDRRWVALEAAPTLRLGHEQAESFARLIDREAAIERNAYMSDDRKRFLIKRLPAWDQWAAEKHSGPYQPRHE